MAIYLTSCAHAPYINLAGSSYTTIDGEPFSFSEKSGQVLLVTYFATWCFPCVAEVPDLIALQQTLGPKGFSVIGVGVDPLGSKVLLPFRDYYQIPYPILLADHDALAGQSPFGAIVGLPTSFILDRRGRLVRSVYGIVKRQALADAIEDAMR
jgi:thiol-disulfide isomerase/thioredoxin